MVLRRTHFSIHRNRRLDRGSPVWLSSSLSMSSSPDLQSCDGDAVSATCCNKALAAKWLWKIFMIWYEIWYDHNLWSDMIVKIYQNDTDYDQNDLTWSASSERTFAKEIYETAFSRMTLDQRDGPGEKQLWHHCNPRRHAAPTAPSGDLTKQYQHISTVWSLLLRTSYQHHEYLCWIPLKSMFIWFSHPQIIWFWYFDFSLGDLKVASIFLLGRWKIRVETSAKPAEAWHGLTEIQHCIALRAIWCCMRP